MGSTLVEYYRTEYRKLNWSIHSGVPVWKQPPAAFNLMSGSTLKCCGDLAMLCTKIVLTDFELVDEEVKERWDNIDRNRNLLYLAAMSPFPNRDLLNQSDGE